MGRGEFECPEFVEAGLCYLDYILGIAVEDPDSPFQNTGAVFECPVFTVRAYNWNEDAPDLPNFECDGFEVRWYKYLGRGMTMNRKVDANEFFALIEKCVKYLKATMYREAGVAN